MQTPEYTEGIQDALNLWESIEPQYKKAGEILAMPQDAQDRIRRRVAIAEARLNSLFGQYIYPGRKSIAEQIQFLDTPDFYEEAILQRYHIPEGIEHFPEIVRSIIQTFDT